MKRSVVRLAALPHLARRVAFRRLFASADRARDGGEWRAAAEAYGRLCRRFPLSASLHVQLGNMLKECGRLDEARQSYDVARWLSPRDGDVWLMLGHLSKLQGRLQEAADYYARSAELDPNRPDAAEELARLRGPCRDDWLSQIGPLPELARTGEGLLPPARFASAAAPMLALERLRVSLAHQRR